MKPTSLAITSVAFIILLTAAASAMNSPTPTNGTANIQVTTVTYKGKYDPKHIGAIWIENANGQFVKSIKVWAKKRIKHLIKWTAASKSNTVDATTSATLKNHQSHAVTWDCTDVSGAVVPDGAYKVFIEFTEDNSNSSGKPPGKWTQIAFQKGSSNQSLTPPDETYFKNLKLTYTSGSGSPTTSISGKVTADNTGNAISDATLRLKEGNSIRYEIKSGSQGVYTFNSIQSGSYTLECSKPGYKTWSENISISSGQQLTSKNIVLTAESGGDTTPPAPPKNVIVSTQN